MPYLEKSIATYSTFCPALLPCFSHSIVPSYHIPPLISSLPSLPSLPLQDLEYGLPVQVRDQALGVKDDLPKSDVGREYYLQNMEKEVGHVMSSDIVLVIMWLLCDEYMSAVWLWCLVDIVNPYEFILYLANLVHLSIVEDSMSEWRCVQCFGAKVVRYTV